MRVPDKRDAHTHSVKKVSFLTEISRFPEILRNFRAEIGKGKHFSSLALQKMRVFAAHVTEND